MQIDRRENSYVRICQNTGDKGRELLPDARGQELLPDAHSYKTRERAVEQVLAALNDSNITQAQWFIIAQADGRFTPCVRADLNAMHFFMSRKISVI